MTEEGQPMMSSSGELAKNINLTAEGKTS